MEDYKRFVGTLARIVFGGVNVFINHKKHSALQKGMKQLLTRQKVNEGKNYCFGSTNGINSSDYIKRN